MGRKSSLNDKITSIEPKSAEHRQSEEVVNDNPAPVMMKDLEVMKQLKRIQTIPQKICIVAQST